MEYPQLLFAVKRVFRHYYRIANRGPHSTSRYGVTYIGPVFLRKTHDLKKLPRRIMIVWCASMTQKMLVGLSRV